MLVSISLDDEHISIIFHSGKTGSFALPLLQLMLLQQQQKQAKKLGSRKQQRRRLGRISTLILCPTRELAAQTGDVFHRLASHLPSSNSDNTDINISIDVVHGGVSTEMQMTRFVEQYNSGVDIDILVATPGRLLDILRNNKNAESSLERRIMDALDGKSMNNNNGRSGRGTKGRRMDARGRGGPGGGRGPRISAASLSLNDIQEMMNDDATVGEERGGSSTIREMFRGLQYLVLDEADRLLGKAFQDEMDELLSLLPISTSSRSDEVNNNSRRQLKTLLFSATFPEQIEARVDRVLSLLSGGVGRPLRVSTTTASGAAVLLPRALSSSASSDRITEAAEDESDSDHLINSSSGDDDDDSEQQLLSTRKHSNTNITPIQNTMPDSGPNIRHRAIRLNEGDRTQALRSLLEQRHADGGGGGGGGADESDDKASDEWNRVLVFVATRYSTEHVSQKLRRLGISASELHGKLDQEARDQRLKQFRSGKTRVLCATDLAARGIDVHGIDLVVNYDLPKSVADYTHRTGRTGRAGSSGTAISFISGKSESHFDFLEKGISSADHKHNGIQRQKIEREVLPNFTPDEAVWKRESAVATISLPGAMHSEKGLEHDRTFGGVKGRRKSKKDKLREAAAAVAAAAASDA